MKNDEVSRRRFLGDSMSVAAAVPFLALVGAAACKSDAPADAPVDKPAPPPADTPAAAGPVCDVSKLPEVEMTKRNALGYIDKTTIPEKTCANCSQYQADNGAGCPGCALFAGPVAAEGYCNSWVPMG